MTYWKCEVEGCEATYLHAHINLVNADNMPTVDKPPPISAENSFYVEYSSDIDGDNFKSVWMPPEECTRRQRITWGIASRYKEACIRVRLAWAVLCGRYDE